MFKWNIDWLLWVLVCLCISLIFVACSVLCLTFTNKSLQSNHKWNVLFRLCTLSESNLSACNVKGNILRTSEVKTDLCHMWGQFISRATCKIFEWYCVVQNWVSTENWIYVWCEYHAALHHYFHNIFIAFAA